jgi:hypothetical protein
MYRAYYGAEKGTGVPPLEKERWPCRQFENLDQALLWSQAVAKHGTAVIAIEGDDGTQLNRSEIAGYLRQLSHADS